MQEAPNRNQAPLFSPFFSGKAEKKGPPEASPACKFAEIYIWTNESGGHASAALGLFFDDLQQLHGTCLDADAAGGAFAGIRDGLVLDDEAEGTRFDALAAAGTEFAADHPDTLGVLGDRPGGTGLGALAALDADHGSDVFAALNDLQGSLIGVEFLIVCVGAGADALQTGHALHAFFDGQLFHERSPSHFDLFSLYNINENFQYVFIDFCRFVCFPAL